MIVIDKDAAIASLRKRLGANPDFVYNPDGERACLYAAYADMTEIEAGERPDICSEPIGPSCAVGQGMDELGVPLWILASLDRGANRWSSSAGDLWRIDVPDFTVTYGASQVFDAAQIQQDEGSTWGEALQAAETAYLAYPEDRPEDDDEYCESDGL